MKMNNKKQRIVVSCIATIFLVALYGLIFSFSEQDGETSGGLSRKLTEKFVDILNALNGKTWSQVMMESMADYFENPIRKLAHFCEYAVMGGLLFCIWYPWVGWKTARAAKETVEQEDCKKLSAKVVKYNKADRKLSGKETPADEKTAKKKETADKKTVKRKETVNKKATHKRIPLLVKIIIPWVFVSAAFDEIHQLFIPGRCGNFWDVLLDTTGGCFGFLCCVWFVKIGERRRIRKNRRPNARRVEKKS